MIKIKEFFIQESKYNKGLMVMVAVDENAKKWVVSGDHHAPTYLVEYEKSSDTKEISYEGDFQNVEYVNYKIIIPKEEPKQDLEKAIFNLEEELDIPSHLRLHNSKTEQEKMYSEEEVIELLTARCKHFGTTMEPFRALLLKQDLDWFEQNKKK